MSKLVKLIRHPWQFWIDALRRRINALARKESGINGVVFGNLATTDPVAVYFDGGKEQIYQLEQWVGALRALDAEQPVTVVCRTLYAFNWVINNSNLRCAYCLSLDDLLSLYQKNPFQCILYVNNAFRNFQSLINARALHVHINHGESDKLSTFSNQSKAYDYVLVAGQAAIDKYNSNLIKKDLAKYLIIGRPQLEHISSIDLRPAPDGCHTTVLYAPTWEGTYDDMNYSSVSTMGRALVQSLLNTPGYRVLYRPHPSTGKRLPDVGKANQAIKTMVSQSPSGLVVPNGDINALFDHADIAILDNSAVAVDYLATGKPLVITDWQSKGADGRHGISLITQAATLIGASQAGQVCQILDQLLHHDPMAPMRQKVQLQFLGPFNAAQQQSTKAFIRAVTDVCQECEQLNLALAAQHPIETESKDEDQPESHSPQSTVAVQAKKNGRPQLMIPS